MLDARETLRDVGTTLTTAQEQRRYSLTAVVQANLKRLQEAAAQPGGVRQATRPALGQALEALRYRSYTLERGLLLGADVAERLADVAPVRAGDALRSARRDWNGRFREAAAGGAQVFQLREKDLPRPRAAGPEPAKCAADARGRASYLS